MSDIEDLRSTIDTLKKVLVEAAIPLEALLLVERNSPMLSAVMKTSVQNAVEQIRTALNITKDPCPELSRSNFAAMIYGMDTAYLRPDLNHIPALEEDIEVRKDPYPKDGEMRVRIIGGTSREDIVSEGWISALNEISIFPIDACLQEKFQGTLDDKPKDERVGRFIMGLAAALLDVPTNRNFPKEEREINADMLISILHLLFPQSQDIAIALGIDRDVPGMFHLVGCWPMDNTQTSGKVIPFRKKEF